jgi:hypothetical protein
MQPTSNKIIVEKQKSDSQFEIAGDDEWVVVSSNSKLFKKGSRVLFDESRSYKYRGQTLIIVNEDDVEAVDAD